jgi:cytoskeletal protein CcmA (bactofilin family)
MAKKKKTKSPKINTVIGSEVQIVGDLNFSGGLYIEGRIKGRISAEPSSRSMLTIGSGGCIEGDVEVPNLVLRGIVTGDVHATETAELLAGAKVQGMVYYRVLEMAMGAEVNGQLVCLDAKDDA